MSTQGSNKGEYGRDYKVLNLSGAQVPIYEEAKDLAERATGEDLTEGEVVRELSRAYLLLSEKKLSPAIEDIVDDHASENGDPSYKLEELEAMDAQRLRKLAAAANSEEIHGKCTRVEYYSYFAERGDE